jgi:hypothetical protein
MNTQSNHVDSGAVTEQELASVSGGGVVDEVVRFVKRLFGPAQDPVGRCVDPTVNSGR